MDIRYYIAFVSEWLGAVSVAWLLSLSPRFQKPQVGFRYARRDGIVALSLYALILLLAVLYYSFVRPIFREPLPPAPAPVHDLGQALLLAGLSLLPFVIALVIRRQPVRSAGWNQAVLGPSLQMGVAIAVLTIFLRNRVMDILGGLATPVISALLLAILISIIEETIFRGYIQMRLAWWLGPNIGLLVSSACFAIWHAAAWVQRLPVETTLILVALTFVQGLVLGWVMRKSGHILAPAIYRSVSIWMQFFV